MPGYFIFVMKTIVRGYIDQIYEIINGLEKQAEIIVENNEDEILDYNRKNQLFDKGIDANGNKLKSYAESTKKRKKTQGLPFNRRTHFDTGFHYKNFYAEVTKRNLEIYADTKTPEGFELGKHLNESEGGNVYGLTRKNNQKVNKDIIKPKLIKWSLNQIKL